MLVAYIVFPVLFAVCIILYFLERIFWCPQQLPLVGKAILGQEEITSHAQTEGKRQRQTGYNRHPGWLRREIRRNYYTISHFYTQLLDNGSQTYCVTASEWFLDNFYLIEETYVSLLKSLSWRRLAHLPLVTTGPYRGVVRAYAVALEIVGHQDASLSSEGIETYLCHYQEGASLKIAELGALPDMICAVLLAHLAQNAAILSVEQENRKKAEECELDEAPLLANIRSQRSLDGAWVEQIMRRLRREDRETPLIKQVLEEKLHDMAASLDDIIRGEHLEQSLRQVSVGNAVSALKEVRAWDWQKLVSSVSLAESWLSADPVGVYQRMDTRSRAYYCYKVQEIAGRSGTAEFKVARLALELAREAWEAGGNEAKLKGHVGWYIIDEGQKELYARMGVKRPVPLMKYFWWAGQTIICLAGLALTTCLLAQAGANILLIVLSLFFLVPAWWGIAQNLTNYFCLRLGRRALLPRIEIGVVPEEAALSIVVPTLLVNPEQAARMARRLEEHYLTLDGGHVAFVLLGDLPDGTQEKMAQDDEIITAAQKEVQKLNGRYGGGFYFLCRRRRYNEQDKIWLGWERKRGALVQFNNFLRGEDGDFIDVSARDEYLAATRYVLTIDADTILSKGAAQELLGIMVHPLASPQIDEKKERVRRGHGIVTPFISTTLADVNKNRFTRIFAGGSGFSHYAAAADIYQDVFGSAIFSGKGLYDVDVFRRLLNGLPENRILSHDLLEGVILRAALAADVQLLDGCPAKFTAWTKRLHRWTRGDWQHWPWFWGKEGHFPALARYQIADNWRRSLLYPFMLVFLAAVWLTDIGSPWLWLGLALAVLLFNNIFNLLLSGWHYLWAGGRGKVFAALPHPVTQSLAQSLFLLLNIFYMSYLLTDAALRSLYRQHISKKRLLEWTTAAEVEKKARGDVSSLIIIMLPGVLFAAPLVLILSWHSHFVLALFLLAVWFSAPWGAARLSRPLKEEEDIKEEDREQLLVWAAQIWQFYRDYATARENYLPPDNLQVAASRGVAHRTSPTNIGFLLLGAACAWKLGVASAEEALKQMENTMATLQKLPKWQGHLYNWYDTRQLSILRPEFISTVDSGNLAVFLMTLTACLKEMAEKAGPDLGERINKLASDARELALGMDFRPLYDGTRHLFYVGRQPQHEKPPRTWYDLLASESRLSSYWAIVKGDVPVEHWRHLSRPLTKICGYCCLYSWSGTMFEYLMSDLVLPSYYSSLLRQSSRSAILAQQLYAGERQIPWGISESGFYSFDLQMNYQYRAFGVPELALGRDKKTSLVVTPYASFLALPYLGQEAMANLRLLASSGAQGQYGLYEAIDYSQGEARVVQSFMSHHQGMSLTAITNYLCDNWLVAKTTSLPQIKAGDFLLQEQIPLAVGRRKKRPVPKQEPKAAPISYALPARIYLPHVGLEEAHYHLLGNGRYSVLLSSEGGSYSWYDDFSVSRREISESLSGQGWQVFWTDVATGVTQAGMPSPYLPGGARNRDKVRFSADKAEYSCSAEEWQSRLEVLVLPEVNGELRRLYLKNNGAQSHQVEVCSYGEPVLTTFAAEYSHPAFSKLFVETEYLPEQQLLLAHRRRRLPDDKDLWLVHGLYINQKLCGDTGLETSRRAFLGRGHHIFNAAALGGKRAAKGSAGPVLDACLSLSCRLSLEAGADLCAGFFWLVAESREEALAQAARLQSGEAQERALSLAATKSLVEADWLRLGPKEGEILALLLDTMFGPATFGRAQKDGLPLDCLWHYGFTGKRPLINAEINCATESELVIELLAAHNYFYLRGLRVELALLANEPAGYFHPLAIKLSDLLSASPSAGSGLVRVLSSSSLNVKERELLKNASNCYLNGADGSLARQLRRKNDRRPALPPPVAAEASDEPYPYPLPSLEFYNGYGGFTADGSGYLIAGDGKRQLPAPWVNVISTPVAGTIISESGGGFTWAENSRENKLTVWSNDPVSDDCSEAIFINDLNSGDAWSVIPRPGWGEGAYVFTHGQGYSQMQRRYHGLRHDLTVFVPHADAAKIYLLELTNEQEKACSLRVSWAVKPVLGVDQTGAGGFYGQIKNNILLLGNCFNRSFPGHTAFLTLSEKATTYSLNNREIWGPVANASFLPPVAERLLRGLPPESLPAAAIQCELELAAGDSKLLVLVIGEGVNEAAALDLAERYRSVNKSKRALREQQDFWRELLTRRQVRTPERSLDILLNSWLLYQTLSSRLWGRCGFYQCGGAYGFRDQLQDVLAVIDIDPQLAKKQILLAASRQFKEGDVVHWWHELTPPRGVRTRFSDDLLWLPYVCVQYAKANGGMAIWQEKAPFVVGKTLAAGEKELYMELGISEDQATLYEHCVLAIDHSLNFGGHGLPKMGGGDWNDGMNEVGIKGEGESVWLGWFLLCVLQEFISICRGQNDGKRASHYQEVIDCLIGALEDEAWDGGWYRRAYDDEGHPIGSTQSDCCRIDSLSQSWAALCGLADKERVRKALLAADEYLVRREEGLVLLLWPPFTDSCSLSPGYIKSYLPGVRENGGQYTHGAVWLAAAWASMGDGNHAEEILRMLNPINHSRTKREAVSFRLEPYVLPADIYSEAHSGLGGWNWYTGAAAWYYKVAWEYLLGVRREGDKLFIKPCLPSAWPGYEAVLKRGQSNYHLKVVKRGDKGEISLTYDGAPAGQGLPFIDDGKKHEIEVYLD